ncbi:MAG: S8 family peptidase [Planctomycetota bacterium]|jgi:subtilisin family serine protease
MRTVSIQFVAIVLTACCVLFTATPLAHAVSIEDIRTDKLTDAEAVLSAFKAGSETSGIIVNLLDDQTPFQPGQWRSRSFRNQWRQRIQARQQQFLESLGPNLFLVRHRLKNQLTFSAHISLETLDVLAGHPLIESIEPIIYFEPHLSQGIALMNASNARMTFSGQGTSVAICDTGIDYTHPMLGGGGFPNGKVIGGYDVGDNDSDPIPEGRAHGTSCAGLAAGDIGSTGDYIGGVAYNAKLYALKITAGSTGSASNSDIAAAWDWCVTHQYDDPANPIMVISTSFGGGRYYSSCDSYSTSLRNAAQNAIAAGITLLASSGNDGYCDSISMPSCLSDVISVGAVYDAFLGTYGFCLSDDSCVPEDGTFSCDPGTFPAWQATGADIVTNYSNTASILDVLAPSHNAYTTDIVGSSGYSSGDYDSSFGGTSAACPYAAGAAACIQSAAKASTGVFLSPAEIKQLLTSTGDNVTDGKAAITKPRVNLGNAHLFS